jgi:hypothetical protein
LNGEIRPDYREAIINALLSGPRTSEDLKHEVASKFEDGFSNSSYHYHLKQLIERGEVEDAKYSYKGQRVSDAVIEEILKPIQAGTGAQAIELSKNLEFLAGKPGITMKPLFLAKTEDCLGSKLIEVRRSALSALSTALWNLSESPDDTRAREKIKERFFDALTEIVKKKIVKKKDVDLDVKGRAIKILAELGDSRAIDILMETVKKATDDHYRELKNSLEQAIAWPYDPNRRPRNYLTRYYHSKILLRLSELAAKRKGKGKARASELAAMIRRGAPGI